MSVGLKIFSQDGAVRLDSQTKFTSVLGTVTTQENVGSSGGINEIGGRVYCRNLSKGSFWFTTYYTGSRSGNVPPRVYREGEWLVWSYRKSDIPSWIQGEVDAGSHKIVYGVY